MRLRRADDIPKLEWLAADGSKEVMPVNECILSGDLGGIHVILGDGKNKTCAALGMAMRAAGADKYVRFIKFYKPDESSEDKILREISEFTKYGETHPFFLTNVEAKRYAIEQERGKFAEFWRNEVVDGSYEKKYDWLILDEIGSVLMPKIIDEGLLIDFIENKPKKMELVLTGRWIPESIIKYADYAGKITKLKHPYDLGIPARESVEY